MPKKPKTKQTTVAASAETTAEPLAATEAPALKKAAAKKKSAAKASGAKAVAKKTGAKTRAKSSTGSAKRAGEPTDEEIRIRAYFIAERRSQMSLHGDPNNDWIQAREELIAELGQNGNGSH